MPIENPENWFLKKHDDGAVFGPIRFDQIAAWARSAQVNPHDMVSNDNVMWTKAPMVPELEMDWLVEVGVNLLYGPTTGSAVLEFARAGEITRSTPVINCRTGETMTLESTPFFDESVTPATEHPGAIQPPRGGIKVSLQKRIRDLEAALIEKRLQLNVAAETISKLENRVRELERQVAELGKRRP